MSYKKKIAVLGSTGSIGVTSLKILNNLKKNFKIELLCANKNKILLLKQIKKYLPKYVIISDYETYNFFLKKKFSKKIFFFNNFYELKKIKNLKFDIVIHGISSFVGLDFSFFFIKLSKKILLANKESIVCGGSLLFKEAKKNNCIIRSVDSEHYCLRLILKNFKDFNIDKIYLTASGGPFLNLPKYKIKKINYISAIKHPKWNMGMKISIDSATMVNKIFEIIEAHYLFNISYDKIKIKIHPQSNIHAVVLMSNNITLMVGHNTSMSIPIENSLLKNYKTKKTFSYFEKNNVDLSFDETKLKKFNLINIGYKIIKYGQRAIIIFNVINDILVYKYLENKIFFYQIEYYLDKIFKDDKLLRFCKKKINNLNDIKETMEYAKKIFNKY